MSIKTVIKRNGEVEQFNINKILNWELWACNGIKEHINWKDIIIKVKSQLQDGMTTQDIQLRLIDECNSRATWLHSLVSGRLYASYISKKIFPENRPTIKELHDKLYNLGVMCKLNYTDEEYDILENIIDHYKDFNMSYAQVNQIVNKYAISDRTTRTRHETPQFVFMRTAMALSEDEAENKIEKTSKFYKYLSEFKINAPTPNYVNLGTDHNGYISCCLYTVGDSAESLAVGDHIAYTMTYMSAGIGGYLMTRSRNDKVKNGKIVHMGKLPYFKSAAAAVKANMQGGRGGSGTYYFMCFDPEVLDIIFLQNPRTPISKQNRDLHFAMQYNALFVEKAYKNENIFTFNIHNAPDLIEAFFSSNPSKFKECYEKYEKDDSFKKNYINARDLAITAYKQSHEVATLYHINIDEVNRHTPFKEPIYQSNLCVAPETNILTKEHGYTAISRLNNKELHVWNGKEWSKTTVIKTGENQKLLTVITDSGSCLEATPYHKWYVQNQDSRGMSTTITEKRTHELLPGDKLIKFSLGCVDHGVEELCLPYENGFYTGDGTTLKHNIGRIYLYSEKQNLLKHFNLEKARKPYIINDNRIEIEYTKEYIKPKFFIPSNIYTLKSRLSWLAGLFDSDGCITDNNGCKSIQLVSTNYDFLVRLKLMLQEIGVYSNISTAQSEGYRFLPDHKGGKKEYFCKTTWRILISNGNLIRLKTLGLDTKRLDLSNLNEGNREANKFITIKEVIDKGRFDDTYCVNEPKEHKVMFEGILTGNCLEILQPTKPYNNITDLYTEEKHERGEISLCALSGIVPSFIDTDEEYEDVAYYTLLMIDKCIHKNTYKFPHLEYTAKSRLNAGVGMIGLAHDLAKRNLKYSSKEGLERIHYLAERHAYFLIKASIKLGKEKGNAPWMHKTKWPEGWLPIDTYNKNIDEIADFKYSYNWEDLRQEVISNKGIRNSCLISYMPTESSSKVTGLPNNVYPIRDIYLKKTDATNAIDFVARDSDTIKDNYQLAWDLTPADQCKFYGVIQKFTDQGISADFYSDRRNNPELKATRLLDEFFNAYKYGMKTRYYTNSKTTKSIKLESLNEERGCSGGSCSL